MASLCGIISFQLERDGEPVRVPHQALRRPATRDPGPGRGGGADRVGRARGHFVGARWVELSDRDDGRWTMDDGRWTMG